MLAEVAWSTQDIRRLRTGRRLDMWMGSLDSIRALDNVERGCTRQRDGRCRRAAHFRRQLHQRNQDDGAWSQPLVYICRTNPCTRHGFQAIWSFGLFAMQRPGLQATVSMTHNSSPGLMSSAAVDSQLYIIPFAKSATTGLHTPVRPHYEVAHDR